VNLTDVWAVTRQKSRSIVCRIARMSCVRYWVRTCRSVGRSRGRLTVGFWPIVARDGALHTKLLANIRHPLALAQQASGSGNRQA